MSNVETFLADFSREEINIVVFVKNVWGNDSPMGSFIHHSALYSAIIDESTNEFVMDTGSIDWLTDKDSDLVIEKEKIYRLKVRKYVNDKFPNRKRYLVESVLDYEIIDPRMLDYSNEYLRDITLTLAGQDFVLDREYGWFTATMEILGNECSVTIESDYNTLFKADKTAEIFMAALDNIEELNQMVKEAAASELLEEANEWNEDNDSTITEEEFISKMNPLVDLQVSEEEIVFMYEDGDMFDGHYIRACFDIDADEISFNLEG